MTNYNTAADESDIMTAICENQSRHKTKPKNDEFLGEKPLPESEA